MLARMLTAVARKLLHLGGRLDAHAMKLDRRRRRVH